MDTLNQLSTICFGHGFGINTNILETNIINLAVVIGVVVSFVGDALRSLLENRKQTILANLEEADLRAKAAKDKLDEAIARLEEAQAKAESIRSQGLVTAEQEKKLCIEQAESDMARLEEYKKQTLRLQQQRAMGQVSQQVISLALEKVHKKLKTVADSKFHADVNNSNIAFFTKYKV
uniref:ATP synthase subunit b, chloroplastic n=1 Tax=Neodangemannia microcystis TaxID=173495 RepID=A0A1W6EH60_9CHLO|nr:CF0 subunit I of ATP synthase [Neodangemannia microcystis]ARK14731.1 CF0 subunit I of ATP synthase [Neodangemannia microcystis]